MRVASLLVALVSMTAVTDAAAIDLRSTESDSLDRRQQGKQAGLGQGRGGGGGGRGQGNGNGNGGNNNQGGGRGDDSLTLDPSVIKGSQITGEQGGSPGQAPSIPSNNNINFCAGNTITNGLQNKQGSCNPGMGDVPTENNMVASSINSPKTCQNLPANKKITLSATMANLNIGAFTNPDNTYYAAPQTLLNGKVVGHTHFVVQDTGNSFDTVAPLSAKKFAFKGVNGAGEQTRNGLVTATEEIADGLPAGCYKFCTMVGSATHQPVIMPIAQRGPQDTCTMFNVGNKNCGCTRTDNNGNGKGGNGGGGNGAA